MILYRIIITFYTRQFPKLCLALVCISEVIDAAGNNSTVVGTVVRVGLSVLSSVHATIDLCLCVVRWFYSHVKGASDVVEMLTLPSETTTVPESAMYTVFAPVLGDTGVDLTQDMQQLDSVITLDLF